MPYRPLLVILYKSKRLKLFLVDFSTHAFIYYYIISNRYYYITTCVNTSTVVSPTSGLYYLNSKTNLLCKKRRPALFSPTGHLYICKSYPQHHGYVQDLLA